MGLMHRSSPCVGICSTTYGDLICRGCKRFAHEIVGWNGFAPGQRDAVWLRLAELRQGSVGDFLRVADAGDLTSRAEQLRVPDFAELDELDLAYEVLRRSRVPVAALAAVGIEVLVRDAAVVAAADVVRLIDDEFFRRSRAHYERNYRIAAQ